jgi:hypothetical protein
MQIKKKKKKLKKAKQAHLVASLLGLLLDPEDGGSTFLRSVGEFIRAYKASHPTR